jgi:leucyl/phenylalanyl-tRNA--protein transferase
MRRRRVPALLLGNTPFPDPELADDEGLIAVGGDLATPRLLAAYDAGIFPWYDEGLPALWWSPNPRAVLDPEHLHVSRSMRRVLAKGELVTSWNTAFRSVMTNCADRDGGTWILPEVLEAYCRLHEEGHAHSVEVWHRAELVGGLYGVQRGGLFAAESMFHRETNASKVALITCVRSLFAAGVELFDVQFSTPHLASMGVREIPRKDYLARLKAARMREISLRDLRLLGGEELLHCPP